MRSVVITGGSGGIGAALAKQLAAQGYRVAIAARREAELNVVAASIGAGAIAIPTDVSRRSEIERLRDRVIDAFGHIDVWVNNAGRGITRPVLELKDEEFDDMMRVNVKSALYGMQAAVPHFIARGSGHLINVSSFLSRVPFAAYRSAYNAAKAALNALTANLRQDLAAAHPNIHVTLVMPGLVTTDFAENAVHGSPLLPAAVTAEAQTAEQVASAIVGVIERPVEEIYTNLRHRDVALDYFRDVGAFERAELERRRR